MEVDKLMAFHKNNLFRTVKPFKAMLVSTIVISRSKSSTFWFFKTSIDSWKELNVVSALLGTCGKLGDTNCCHGRHEEITRDNQPKDDSRYFVWTDCCLTRFLAWLCHPVILFCFLHACCLWCHLDVFHSYISICAYGVLAVSCCINDCFG